MWDLSSPWTALDWGPPRKTKESVCAPLCQHPPCWEARSREVKGITRQTPPVPPKEEIETDLPTVKICNMLEDYGDDPLDRFPAKYDGKPEHSRKVSMPRRKVSVPRNSGLKVPSPPIHTPTSDQQTVKSAPVGKPIKLVEVQEMFDVEDLQTTWDDTFLPKKYYVWVPNPKKKKQQRKKDRDVGPQKIYVKDLTEDMIPREFELEQGPKMRRRAVSPASSRYRRTPYSKSSSVGMRPYQKPLGETVGLDELLDLPREILVQVLDHARQSDFSSSQKLHELIQKFVPEGFYRENTNLTTTSADLLQQKKMNIYEGKERKLRESHLMETRPVYYLDEEGVEKEVFPGEEGEVVKAPMPLDSDYGSLRDLYGLSGTREFPRLRKPLPPIQDQNQPKLPSISLGLPELPSGVRHTKAFTYTRRNYRNYDFTLGPVPTPPTSARTTDTAGSDHGTTIHVNIPSATSQPECMAQITQQGLVDGKQPMSAHSERSGGRHTPLHAVSPAQSTKVPTAPATTPATHGLGSPMKGITREVTSSSTANRHGNKDGSVSPTQDIRAPVNSPRMMSPEPTGLGTIQETGIEDGTHPVSRGGRSVRFAEEVPEVPPPPSSPQLDEDQNTDSNALRIPDGQYESGSGQPVSRETALTNQPTFNTADKELTEEEMQLRSAKRRESSMNSTPEPWPQVNEADFDITPANTKLALHETSRTTNGAKAEDSRLAHHDVQSSERTVGTESASVRSSEMNSRDSTRSYLTRKEESPAPPPPSPEGKDKNSEESRSARKRESKSRESNTTMPLIEENEEETETDGHVRTLVVEVPPLGQSKDEKTQTKSVVKRTVDTFVNIDIPAQTKEELAQEAMSVSAQQQGKGNGRRLIIESTLEEEDEDVTTQDEGTTLNTREQNLSVQSSSVDGPSTVPESEVESAGVDPSVGGNVSPSSTITDTKLNNQDLRNFIEQQQEDVPEIQEREEENDPPSTRREDHIIEGREADEPPNTQVKVPEEGQGQKEEVTEENEITEKGGDHDGFKQELREELERMSQDDKTTEKRTEENTET